MKKTLLLLILGCTFVYIAYSQTVSETVEKIQTIQSIQVPKSYPAPLVNYDDYKALVMEVEEHRQSRLVSLDSFLKMSKEPNTIILDTRSDLRYDRKRLKGAIHLSFTDFTQANLQRIIPDRNTRILIYCNNNFEGDQFDFASKLSMPRDMRETEILDNRKPTTLALNIPTYINLYGYGYKNVYELGEMVNVNDQRIEFEGTVATNPDLIRFYQIGMK